MATIGGPSLSTERPEPISAGEPITARFLNELLAGTVRAQSVAGGPGVTVESGPEGVRLAARRATNIGEASAQAWVCAVRSASVGGSAYDFDAAVPLPVNPAALRYELAVIGRPSVTGLDGVIPTLGRPTGGAAGVGGFQGVIDAGVDAGGGGEGGGGSVPVSGVGGGGGAVIPARPGSRAVLWRFFDAEGVDGGDPPNRRAQAMVFGETVVHGVEAVLGNGQSIGPNRWAYPWFETGYDAATGAPAQVPGGLSDASAPSGQDWMATNDLEELNTGDGQETLFDYADAPDGCSFEVFPVRSGVPVRVRPVPVGESGLRWRFSQVTPVVLRPDGGA